MSVVEIARLQTSNGDDFERCVIAALDALVTDPGCLAANAYRGIETPDAFVLEVHWESLEAHERFRAGPGLPAYRSHIQHLLAGTPEFAHYRDVASAGGEESAT